MTANAASHRVCVRWEWLGKQAGFRDISPRPDSNPPFAVDWDTYNYDEDAEDDRGRRDQAGDLAPRRADATGTLWGWDFLDESGCTELFDTEAATVDLDIVPWSYWTATRNQVVAFDCTTGDCVVDPHTSILDVPMGVQDIVHDEATSEIGYDWAIIGS